MSNTPTTPERPTESPAAQPTAAPAATPKPRSALALWAMIAGIVAMVSAIIPGLSFVAWIPAVAAIALGLIALIRKTPRRGQALTGVVLGPIAWVTAIIVSVGLIAGISGGADDAVDDEPVAVEEAPAPVAEEPEPVAEPEPEPEVIEPAADVVYSGTGDTILQIELPAGPDSIGIATMAHSGSSNFAVWSLDANLNQSDLLVNEIGRYAGTVPFNLSTAERITALEITADGAWTVTLRDVLSVRELPESSTTTGQGDDVLVYLGDATIADLAHTGDSNFAVWSYGSSSDLVVNEIGAYTGQVRWPAGTALVQISANGAWTIALQ
ncbi:DUF4190 domain-containing protein [Microcella alkalica]|uniref:DUF4190 domain-containing protein n=1 Tax=Microcella alkalica TaxID=355930 RepID=A0A839E746_9MICO|nr:DUF4190 domain-containing protein [Microcella alkalica]MBA8847600.1 hypothetical protein [Microcella alkalica]